MLKATTPLILLLLVAVAGCGQEEDLTVADPDDSLGKQIVGAVAEFAAEAPYPGYPFLILRPRLPLDLSEVAIVDDWKGIRDPGLAEELAKYVREEFPGTVMDCDPSKVIRTGRNCFPLNPDALPPDGMLVFNSGYPDKVGVHHYYPVTWKGVPSFDEAIYGFELERLEDGGWKVAGGRYICCP